MFTSDTLPAATLPIYPGLGPASRDTEMCLRWLGFSPFLHLLMNHIKNGQLCLGHSRNSRMMIEISKYKLKALMNIKELHNVHVK